jgi:hypothetical protein
LLKAGLADEVAMITSPKPFARPGVLALSNEARQILADDSRYRQLADMAAGVDRLRRWERVF